MSALGPEIDTEFAKLYALGWTPEKLGYAIKLAATHKVEMPLWMTKEQAEAVIRKYEQNPDGSPNMASFFARVQDYGDYAGIAWCGMFLGIEKDGYTHS